MKETNNIVFESVFCWYIYLCINMFFDPSEIIREFLISKQL